MGAAPAPVALPAPAVGEKQAPAVSKEQAPAVGAEPAGAGSGAGAAAVAPMASPAAQPADINAAGINPSEAPKDAAAPSGPAMAVAAPSSDDPGARSGSVRMATPSAPEPLPVVPVVSGLLLLAGLVLVALRFAGRRLAGTR